MNETIEKWIERENNEENDRPKYGLNDITQPCIQKEIQGEINGYCSI